MVILGVMTVTFGIIRVLPGDPARLMAGQRADLQTVASIRKQLKLDQRINLDLQLFKMYAPYTEADHILNIAYNLLAGGTCLEHLELRRQDEAYLDALGAVRVPDPTTAGDFCRRFNPFGIFALMHLGTQVPGVSNQPEGERSKRPRRVWNGSKIRSESCGEADRVKPARRCERTGKPTSEAGGDITNWRRNGATSSDWKDGSDGTFGAAFGNVGTTGEGD